MEMIKSLIDEGFSVMNIGENKLPVNYNGDGLTKWESLTYDELCKEHNLNVERWGLKLGQHENGRRIMSLDFDCCGKENKASGERVGCKYTQEKLKEYLADCTDNEDGLYTSSTKGNMNLLVDYTNCKKVLDVVELLNKQGVKNKFSIESLEVLFGSGCQQVIPPTATKCKITKELGEKRKFLNDKPLYILENDGWVVDFIMNIFQEKINKLNPYKTPPSSRDTSPRVFTPIHSNAEVQEDIYLDLLFNVIGNGCNDNGSKKIERQDWLAIGGALKGNNYNESVFISYSNPQANKHNSTAKKTWDSITFSNPMFILQGLAKKYNPHGYEKWFMNNKKYIKLSILNKGENDIAKYIADYLHNKVVYCNNRWWVFDTNLKIWRIGNPVAIIISEMQRQIDIAKKSLITAVIDEEDEEKKKKYIKMQKDYDNFRSAVGKSGFANQVITCLKEYALDTYFEEKLDVAPYKVAYKNGILDLKTLVFKPNIVAEDFLTSFIPYDYEVGIEEDITWVRNQIFKICNCNIEHFNYYLSFLGYAMTGDSSKHQAFFNILGQKASNGKSIIFEALMKIIPNYITEGENDIFECNYGSRHKEIATWRGIRILWINELTKKKQDAEVIKKVSDGTSIKYKVMYGINGIMPITFKMAVVSNNTLKIDGDNGIARRLKTMQMNSDFSKDAIEDNYETKVFIRDESFGEKLQTKYKNALMSLIYQYSKSFVDDGYKMKPLPKDWEEESENIVASNNKFQEFFDRYFIADPNEKISKKRIEEIMTDCNIHANIKDELIKMKLNVKYKSQEKCKGSGGVKGVWEGIREKTDKEKEADEAEV
jgi:hypothetical protein